MPENDWSALYLSVPTRLKNRIDDAAAADGRTRTKWIERLLTEHFEKMDKQCNCNISASDTDSVP